jgi:N-acetylglucosaminyldiphosphoundecaprenol N-acetyl-beta-D-mannosaminyltransferase
MLSHSQNARVSYENSPSRCDRDHARRANLDAAASPVRICNTSRSAQPKLLADMPALTPVPTEVPDTRERRANPLGRAATASIPRETVGGLRLAVLDLEQTADFMIDMVFPCRRVASRPLYLTSANGEVLSRCSTEPMTDRLFRSADLINADGQPLVMMSKLRSQKPLPERVATTDLFHVVARKAQALGLTFYMFGANEAENEAAVANVRRKYPKLKIVGHSHGYLRGDALRSRVDEINALAPDFLWIALGVPYEQAFVDEFISRLSNVGVIKTSGGLFNFLSGSRPRAPKWMQSLGLEWVWRLWLEPRRLFWRYLRTNPHALYLLFNHTRESQSKRD